jgi:UDPglucose 6-dehydrogenase
MLISAIDNKKIEFSSDLARGVKSSQAIILAVGTPQDESSGKADLSYIYSASKEASQYVDEYKIFITKSTVPVGTNHEIKKIIEENCGVKIDVASNPEFMREGFALDDFMKPDRIVIGVENEKSQKILEYLYCN